nr:hypothetical protein [Variovorax boronicumulans]
MQTPAQQLKVLDRLASKPGGLRSIDAHPLLCTCQYCNALYGHVGTADHEGRLDSRDAHAYVHKQAKQAK